MPVRDRSAMWTLVQASMLAASVVTFAEWTTIITTCGPFWAGFESQMRTLLIYFAVTLAVGVVLELLIRLVRSLDERLKAGRFRFAVLFLASVVPVVVAVTALIYRDLNDSEIALRFSALAFGAIVIAGGIAVSMVSRFKSGPSVAVLGCVLATVCVQAISSNTYSKILDSRIVRSPELPPAHVLLIILDTTRSDFFSSYGFDYPTTPNFDRTATEGLLCLNSYSTAHYTPPGHMSIFTGLYPPQLGPAGCAFMPDEVTSLTEILRDAGYFSVGLYNNGLAGRAVNLTQGFDVELGVHNNSWIVPAPFRLWNTFVRNDAGAAITFAVASDVFEWVSDRGGRLFLYANLFEPHHPYQAHEPFFSDLTSGLDLAVIPRRETVEELMVSSDLARGLLFDKDFFKGFAEESYQLISSVYASEIAYVDRRFGEFQRRLVDTGLWDDTLAVVTGDHGEFLGEHWTMLHPSLLFEPVIRVPLIFRYPDYFPPSSIRQPTSTVDVLPTVLGALGLKQSIPADVQGVDLMEESATAPRLLLSANQDGKIYSLVDGHFKLILNLGVKEFPHDSVIFDLEVSPEESPEQGLDDEEHRAAMIRSLRALLARISIEGQQDVEVSDEALRLLKELGYIS